MTYDEWLDSINPIPVMCEFCEKDCAVTDCCGGPECRCKHLKGRQDVEE